MLLEDLGTRIREARAGLGLTQADVAGSLQVSAQAVSKWERGENAPDITLLPDLARLLGVTTDRFLGTHIPSESTVDMTVCFSDIANFTKRVEKLEPSEVATVLNAHYLQITDLVLKFDGVPVKYIGDSFLYFSAGPEHRMRAVRSALSVMRVLDERISTSVTEYRDEFAAIVTEFCTFPALRWLWIMSCSKSHLSRR
jgi:transcriptional regulator with XRE-family HTH domain